jgi:hypothetical protein
MAFLFTFNGTLQEIVSEAEGLDAIEQKMILAYIRALRIVKSGAKPLAKSRKKPLTMEQIDQIKHEVRAK